MPDTSESQHVIPLMTHRPSPDVPYMQFENCNMEDTITVPENVNPLVTRTTQLPFSQFLREPDRPVAVGPNSCKVMCPSCRATVYTRVEKVSTTKTHGFAFKLCLVIFCCPCVSCLPYCMDSCKAANHFCPHCDSFLGTYDH